MKGTNKGMLIPVKVGGVNYSIKMVDKNDDDISEGNRGICYYEDLLIKIDKTLPKDLLKQTMYHELSHAICEQTSFNSMLEDKLGENGYEIFIDNMGKVLYTLFHENNLKMIEDMVKGEFDV